MRRPMIGRQKGIKSQILRNRGTGEIIQNDDQVEERLRQNRSKDYIEQISQIDARGQLLNQQQIDKLLASVRSEFPNLPEVHLLKGIVGKCYLGEPYEVHTLSLELAIVHHYKSHEPLPDNMERARRLAMNEHYAFIEVYDRCIRAVKQDGGVSVVKG